MKYKVTATYTFIVEADEPEWAQELVDVNSLHYIIMDIEGTQRVEPVYEVEEIESDDRHP